eukprot:366193-Chlamydomonas_euryale.AAC.1
MYTQPVTSSDIGIARLPGSTQVWDRSGQRLAECTPALCPFAVVEETYAGRRLVNRAPHTGSSA